MKETDYEIRFRKTMLLIAAGWLPGNVDTWLEEYGLGGMWQSVKGGKR